MTDKPILPSSDDLDRYLAGEDSDATQRVRAYLAANPAGDSVVRAVRQTVRGWGGGEAMLDPHESLKTIMSIRKSPRVYKPFHYVGIAAALVIGIFAIKHIPNLTTTTQSTPATKTYTTTPGQRANIQLSDGSSVIIAPATEMHVTGRDVELKGEAVFTVTQNSNNPFTVHANGVTTRVLGTTFGVRAYDSVVTVAVRDGKVVVGQGASLAARPQDATLSAGDVAVAAPTGFRITHNANIASLLSWTEGRFSFRGVPLDQVVRELSRHYAAEILISTPDLASRKVLLDVGPNDSIFEVLNALAGAIGARIERHGVRYLILGS